MKLRVDPPADYEVANLAPVVEIIGGERRGSQGYALALLSIAYMVAVGHGQDCPGGVRVLTAAHQVIDVDVREVLFKS